MKKTRCIAMLLCLLMTMLAVAGCGAEETVKKSKSKNKDKETAEKYSVDYCGRKDSFSNAKDKYKAGQEVTLYYEYIATDTDYRFYLDDEDTDLDVSYDAEHGYVLTFVMPEHDIEVHVESQNTMMMLPQETIDEPVDLSDEEKILAFLAGNWTLIDLASGSEVATMELKGSGSFTFERLKSGASGNGKLSFEHLVSPGSEAPDRFRLSFDDMQELLPPGEKQEEWSATETSGIFTIGRGETCDYLFLQELGNGDTMVSAYAFNTNEDLSDHENWSTRFLFTRTNENYAEGEPRVNETFYAWAWECQGSRGVWLQPMEIHTYDTFEEYTDRAFVGAYFTHESSIGAGFYAMDYATEIYGVKDPFPSGGRYPLCMYEVKTDGWGDIEKLTELDTSFYGVYDMGDREPAISCDGTNFFYNNSTFEMREFAPAATAIEDCVHVGDWIIVNCHVNPHNGIYAFFNIPHGDFTYGIIGANLNWQGDDLSTAVYSMYNDVFDIWGRQIGHVQEGKIVDLSFIDEQTVGVQYWVLEGQEEKTYFEECEYEPAEDSAVFDYYMTLLGQSRQCKAMEKKIPENAVALIMVDPPQEILDRIYVEPREYEKNALDTIVVVSLTDGQQIEVGPIDAAAAGQNENGSYAADKWHAEVIKVTAPEGLPANRLTITTADGVVSNWDIASLSGKSPRICRYLIAGEQGTAQE